VFYPYDIGVPYQNQWVYAVLTFDGTTLKSYINGILRNQWTRNGILTYNINGNIWLGGRNSTDYPRYFSGAIDDVRIYNRALTSAEILQLYNE